MKQASAKMTHWVQISLEPWHCTVHTFIDPSAALERWFSQNFSPPTSHTAARKLEGWKSAFLGVVHFNFSSLARSDAKRFVFLSSYPADASRPLMDVGVKRHFMGLVQKRAGFADGVLWGAALTMIAKFAEETVGVNHVNDLEGTDIDVSVRVWGFPGVLWIFPDNSGEKKLWLLKNLLRNRSELRQTMSIRIQQVWKFSKSF